MTRRLLLVAVAVAGLGAAWLALDRLAEKPAPPSLARDTAPAATPKRADTPAPAPAPAPTADAARRPARRTAPKPSPREAVAPAAETLDVATLRIDADVPGAQVFVDREFIGQAPVTAQNVKPGTHKINVAAPGYDGVAETIDVAPGSRDVMLRLKEVRLDAKLDVIHKHRFGSCHGRLSATPQGLRYDASDRSDAFAVALADMEAFDVDYLKKNLRVKVRKGRQFDFTDPDGNADRLFVFQRDVAKAAEKLKRTP